MFRLAYGSTEIELDSPLVQHATIIQPRSATPIEDPPAYLNNLLQKQHLLSDQLSHSDRLPVTLVIPDLTRGEHFATLLPVLIHYLQNQGVGREEIRILVGGGAHRLHTKEEMLRLLGEAASWCQWSMHDCDSDVLVDLGQTQRGTSIKVHPWLTQGSVIVLGVVKHHYFAGYSGGRKAILPGCASRDSILANHSLCFEREQAKRHPGVGLGRLTGNPVHEDMQEAVEKVRVIAALQLVLGADHHPAAMFFGELSQAFDLATQQADRLFRFDRGEGADYVLASCSGYPGDINFVQSHKGIHHAASFVRPGGVIVILAQCREGIGNPDLLDWASIGDPVEMIQRLKRSYSVPGQTALAMLEKAARYRIFLFSELPPEQVKLLGMTPLDSAQQGLQQLSGQGRGVILPHADQTLAI